MKFVWINVIAIIIAFSSVVLERPSVYSGSSSIIETLQSIPFLQSDVLRDVFSKHTEKTVRIAQDFFPIVTIADSECVTTTFFHYFPIYSQVRQKEYFLLI
jgi:hypothetical protein